jgi:hypothetical protein
MADRIVSETAGIRRLRTVKGQRWREDARGDNAADRKRQGRGSRPQAKAPGAAARRKSKSGGGIDEFA